MKRKIIRFVSLCMAVYCLLSTQVFALNDGNLQKADTSDGFVQTSFTADLDFGGKFIYGADVIAKQGASSSYCSIVIQQMQSNGEYTDVPGTFLSDYDQSRYATVQGVHYVYGGYWYRTEATVVVIKDNKKYKTVKYSDGIWLPK